MHVSVADAAMAQVKHLEFKAIDRRTVALARRSVHVRNRGARLQQFDSASSLSSLVLDWSRPHDRMTAMSMEGSVHILKHDGSPPTYDVTFAPYAGPGGALPVRRFTGDGELEDFLRRGIRAQDDAVEKAMKGARGGSATVPNVILSPEQQKALRL
jgi:hypothetical protein